MTVSTHALVQRIYGGRRQQHEYRCPALECRFIRIATSTPVCPAHNILMAKRERKS